MVWEDGARECPSYPIIAKKAHGIRMAVMDMWKPFGNSTRKQAPQAAILFDKFHVLRHLSAVLDGVRKSEYARLAGQDRRYSKGQKYTLLASRENLTRDGRQALKKLLAANTRLNTAPLSFVEGVNNKIRVIQRRAYGLKDEEYLRLKVLTCILPAI